MCSSKSKLQGSTAVDHININGRPVLQPTCNVRVPLLDRRNSVKKKANSTATAKVAVTPPPISPKLISPAVKRGNDPNGLNSSGEKVVTPRESSKSVAPIKKSKKVAAPDLVAAEASSSSLRYASSLIVEAPGSIAAARREQVAIMQVQRKMKIAHYGRTNSGKYQLGKVVPLDSSSANVHEEKRCSFITSNSDPIYVAYHDEEWGVPVHDDNLLFELLVLTGAQVGSDWTSVLKKRQGFREAFSGFDAEIVSKFSEKKISSIRADYDIEISQIRGVVDNANRILEIKKEFRSFDKYLWGFVNHKPINTQYKSSHKMPVKTSKSESISKDMVRRGFRLVGPTVIHSFMQAAGLTNDHLTTCPRHLQCVALASPLPTAAPAL
ncbi:hypothetical protein Vadar_003034 [Vaccinium darrowii]|uniref:Uncharacterized protein n=1 Tax=Vaccinium darrowii TaxID=229202 RepID=A0ACB7X7F2_9ERIC|nr:hypothetical protein Vadar_003034 [Vaccinium darrowii]